MVKHATRIDEDAAPGLFLPDCGKYSRLTGSGNAREWYALLRQRICDFIPRPPTKRRHRMDRPSHSQNCARDIDSLAAGAPARWIDAVRIVANNSLGLM